MSQEICPKDGIFWCRKFSVVYLVNMFLIDDHYVNVCVFSYVLVT